MNYQEEAIEFANKFDLTLEVGTPQCEPRFSGEKEKRWVFPCTLRRGDKSYSFEFGQSIAEGMTPPDMYDVLSCVEKHEVGDFEYFCQEFGYDNEPLHKYHDVMKIYKSVVKEYEAILDLFGGSIPDELHEIA